MTDLVDRIVGVLEADPATDHVGVNEYLDIITYGLTQVGARVTSFVQIFPKMEQKRLGPFTLYRPSASLRYFDGILSRDGVIPPRIERVEPLFYHKVFDCDRLLAEQSAPGTHYSQPQMFGEAEQTVFVVYGRLHEEVLLEALTFGGIPGKVLGFWSGLIMMRYDGMGTPLRKDKLDVEKVMPVC